MPTLVHNQRLKFDYEILENFTAGIVLTGAEVKSCKRKQVSLQGAYIIIEGGAAWLKNARVSPYQANNQRHYDPLRLRKLLLRRVELASLTGKLQQAGLTLLPESLYTQGGLVKVKLVLVRGRKKVDKRALIKKRDVDRRIAQALRRAI
ncbi:MAG: SsrA-binding protein SmpB [Candidatus Kerfeldbacteria bacterium]|nr:SsrA-binding protein SmpB [Candidatus Kerfeldbacteria bacterium]